jgi:hypothetical protein
VFGTAAAVALGFTLYVTFGLESAPDFLGALIVTGLPALLVGSVLTALGLVVFGLPATWLLARLRRESGPSYLLAGAAAGFVAGLPYLLVAANGSLVGVLLLAVAPGTLCGWLWWRFARRARQERPTEVAGTFE